MIRLEIPGWDLLNLTDVVFDVNGTLAVDGALLPAVIPLFNELRDSLSVHLLTANTHGRQGEIDRQLALQATRIESGREAEQKAQFVRQLGADTTAAVGQGANDADMLAAARLGICLISPEGTARETLSRADIIVPDIEAALNLLLHPQRLKATLRH